MLKLLREIIRTGDVTTRYPDKPFPVSPHFRGRVEHDVKLAWPVRPARSRALPTR
jgi:formate hydrogenlyase subunit 6/NADH:ubiquinone oxidoreductase subunit I